MDRAFKIIGALGLSLSAGALLGMTTPVTMKDAPEAGWRMAARAAPAAAPLAAAQAAPVIYTALPEDLSPAVGYGSPAAYQARYVEAPVRTGYTAVPADADAAAAVPVPVPAARSIPADHAAHGAPVTLATAKTVSMPAPGADPAFDPVFDASGDAPAMDAGGED